MTNQPLKRAITILSRLLLQSLREEDISYVCMHCDKLMRGPKNRKDQSHGVCKECFEKYYPDIDDGEELDLEQEKPAVACYNSLINLD